MIAFYLKITWIVTNTKKKKFIHKLKWAEHATIIETICKMHRTIKFNLSSPISSNSNMFI